LSDSGNEYVFQLYICNVLYRASSLQTRTRLDFLLIPSFRTRLSDNEYIFPLYICNVLYRASSLQTRMKLDFLLIPSSRTRLNDSGNEYVF
jgi:hypothetical protein